MSDFFRVLLLAGTFEARMLAKGLKERFPAADVTVSFSGAVHNLPDPGFPVRVGGFGGAGGLVDYLRLENISLVVDATHPFAVQISRNAVIAAKQANVPLVRLERPAWQAEAADRWNVADSFDQAAGMIPTGARAFLAVGRNEIEAFTGRHDIVALVRMIEPPKNVLPGDWTLVLSRPPQSVEEETVLLLQHGITHLVSKNSGGERSYAKIAAARNLRLPIIIIARPQLPAARTASTIESILQYTDRYLTQNASGS